MVESPDSYAHTQRAPLHLVLWAIVLAFVVLALTAASTIKVPFLFMAGLLAFFALCFAHLTVRDAGDALEIAYGPLPLFRHRIAYGRMTGVERTRSALIDGWGIHWVPWRGLIFNLWGWDCVRIRLGKGSIRVGTDDREGLARFLETKLGG